MQQTIEIINTPRKRVITMKNLNAVDLKQIINSAMESSLLSYDDKKVHNNEHDKTNIGSNNNNKNRCPRCLHNFSSPQRLQSHLRRKLPCKYSELSPPKQVNENSPHSWGDRFPRDLNHEAPPKLNTHLKNITCEKVKFICEFCGICFTQKYNLNKHQKYNCKKLTQSVLTDDTSISDLKKTVSLLVDKIAKLEENPSNKGGSPFEPII